MIIGLCGTRNAGKNIVAQYLVNELGFTQVADTTPFQNVLPSAHVETLKSAPVKHSSHPSPDMLRQCWRSNINVVIECIDPFDIVLPDLLKRPYFALIYVDAPFGIRFQRAVAAGLSKGIMDFISIDDKMRARRPPGYTLPSKYKGQNHIQNCLRAQTGLSLIQMQQASRVQIFNDCETEQHLYESLRRVNFTSPELLRPSWDTYFMSLAKLASLRTNCMKRHVGCVIAKDKRVIATGYNGTPSGVTNCMEGGCQRCNGTKSNLSSKGVGLDLCLCLHAEENAIIEAGRERCNGSTLYTNLFPCILCAKKIVQSGIERVVFDKHYCIDVVSESLLRAGGVLIEQHQGDQRIAALVHIS